MEGLEGIIPNLVDSLGDAGEAVWPQDSKKKKKKTTASQHFAVTGEGEM